MDQLNHILPAIAAIIFNEKGEILLQKRRDTNQWCVLSGHVEFGETVENAALREIWEETRCNAEIIRLIGIYSTPHSQTYHYPDRNVQYITSYFEVRLTSDIDLNYTNEETAGLKYFNPDHLPEEMAQLNENWLHDALNKNNIPYLR